MAASSSRADRSVPLFRRTFLEAGAAIVAGLPAAFAAQGPIEVRMTASPDGSCVGFDPVGIFIESGQTVRWRCEASVHTTTAYDPANANHSLRIPKGAKPWDSGFLFPGKMFDVVLTVPGVYDYYCEPHEAAGMVGRIIVGHPAGPGMLPFDYFEKLPNPPKWLPVPKAAQANFPPIAEIMKRHVVPSTAPCPGT